MFARSAPLPVLVDVPPHEFGIGARLTLGVAGSDAERIVVDAFAQAPRERLIVTPDDVSVHVTGPEEAVLGFALGAIQGAAGSGAPVVASLMLSRGCPGGVVCALPAGGAVFHSEVPSLPRTGVRVRGQWALYPLDDTGGDHMAAIQSVITEAQDRGIVRQVLNYVTTLEGDLGEVVETVGAAWILAGRSVQHVATHLTLWANGPAVPPALAEILAADA